MKAAVFFEITRDLEGPTEEAILSQRDELENQLSEQGWEIDDDDIDWHDHACF